VRFLKLIANAIWAAVYGSLLITCLILFLNDDLTQAGWVSLGALFVSVAAAYVPIIAVLLPLALLFIRIFAVKHLTPTWASLKTILWFGVATLAVMTVVFYVNLRASPSLLSPESRGTLRGVSAAMAAVCLAGLATASLGQFRSGPRAHRLRLLAGCLLVVPLILAPLALPRSRARPAGAGAEARGRPSLAERGDRFVSSRPHLSLLLVGVDAASMDFILPLVSARELPALERLMSEGASARLDAIRPCVSSVAWTTLLTGMPPWHSGVRGDRVYSVGFSSSRIGALPRMLGMHALMRFGFGRAAPSRASERLRPTIGEILRGSGIVVEEIGWEPTHAETSSSEAAVQVSVEAARRIGEILGSLPATNSVASWGPAYRRLRRTLVNAITQDLDARDAAQAVQRAESGAAARVRAIRLPGLAEVSRHFLRYHEPENFGDVTSAERELFGPVLSRYYKFIDEVVGELVAAAGPRGYILVVSSHGVEPVPEWRRLVRPLVKYARSSRADDPGPSGSWSRGPDGILMIRGPGVVAGARLDSADIMDVVPTALYLLGLPVGRDMGGRLQKRLLHPAFLESHPVLFIPGY